ncbi:RidA family protein [Porifericola rhodea]|uniref:RidA family protein n=1 Tax=Porifericola rhodea TaxID=930972 RepID=UPI002666D11E|nr:RidA family protein [Porifericola rhodea]WKN32083.1 RidA family protein [Porifericola rhodea]
MQKKVINPWVWQNERSYSQAIEVSQAVSTLYISGQTAINDKGISSAAEMAVQLEEAMYNLGKVIEEAGYQCKNIVRLNVYTTSVDEFMQSFSVFQAWVARHNIQQATTLIEVKSLFESLKIELEATAVK